MSLRGVLAIMLVASSARGQTINIWPGVAPGSEHWTQKEVTIPNTPVGTVIMNVVTPTLTAYLPSRAKATGTGVIIAPGGGRPLSAEHSDRYGHHGEFVMTPSAVPWSRAKSFRERRTVEVGL